MAKRLQFKFKFKSKKYLHIITSISLFLILILLSIVTFEAIFEDKIFPRIFVGNTHLIFLTPEQADRVLVAKFNEHLNGRLSFNYNQSIYAINLATTEAKINTHQVSQYAFKIGHSDNWYQKIKSQIKLFVFGEVIIPQIDLSLDSQLDPISKQIRKEPKEATLSFSEATSDSSSSAQIQVTPSKSGLDLDKEALEQSLKNYIVFGINPTTLPVKEIAPKTTTTRVEKAKAILEEISRNPIKLVYGDQSWNVDNKSLITLLDLTSDEVIDQKKLSDYLNDLSEKINQPVIEGQFNFDSNQQKVTIFKAAQEGRELDIKTASTLINLAIEGKRSKNVTLPVKTTQPKITTEQVNNLGIKELLGQGVSNFVGSIPNRIYNIGLAAARINGVLIAPGEAFSFNDRVGDISSASGYKPAYVIKSGRTVLDDGGGVCQVSTTIFRAVLNSGLPVITRTAHAYRVGYYEQGFPPGLDATVFSPSVDFRFKNDTPSYILIQAYTVGNSLYIDLYGTSDGRVAALSKPLVTDSTPPPPELRQDDPTLPKGEVKQVDFPAWGANVSFNRTVTREGQTIISETFRSNYKPWQAIYLVGTKEN